MFLVNIGTGCLEEVDINGSYKNLMECPHIQKLLKVKPESARLTYEPKIVNLAPEYVTTCGNGVTLAYLFNKDNGTFANVKKLLGKDIRLAVAIFTCRTGIHGDYEKEMPVISPVPSDYRGPWEAHALDPSGHDALGGHSVERFDEVRSFRGHDAALGGHDAAFGPFEHDAAFGQFNHDAAFSQFNHDAVFSPFNHDAAFGAFEHDAAFSPFHDAEWDRRHQNDDDDAHKKTRNGGKGKNGKKSKRQKATKKKHRNRK
jgi:hypothetical protein